MCCSGDRTAKATETSQAAFTNTLQGAFNTAFGSNQAILGSLSKTLQNVILNPHGFDPATLTAMRTTARDTVTKQTQGAEVAANAAIAARGGGAGGADLGSGVSAQITGNIAAAGAEEQSREQNAISINEGMLKNQNYWNAISGLTKVAEAYNPQGYAGQATGAANSVANLSQAVLASQQAGWQNTFGIIKGITGLATAAAGLPALAGSAGGGGGFNYNPSNSYSPGFSQNPTEGYT